MNLIITIFKTSRAALDEINIFALFYKVNDINVNGRYEAKKYITMLVTFKLRLSCFYDIINVFITIKLNQLGPNNPQLNCDGSHLHLHPYILYLIQFI